MKLESLQTSVTEVEVEGHGVRVIATTWGTHEGVSVMVHDRVTHALMSAFSLRHEQVDVLLVALQAARAGL
jgi:hypothetical protein